MLGQGWLIAAMAFTAVAAGLLGGVLIPEQGAVNAGLAAGRAPEAGLLRRLAMTAGLFNLAWAITVVLMVVRPGSTTGV